MAETSRPWPGTTIGDAGPYNSEDWWDVWGATGKGGVRFGRSADYNIGVLSAIGSGLFPVENGANIDVATGASLIDGLYHENTAVVSIPITNSGAGTSRIDVIVVRKNYQQAVTYTPTGGAPTVPPRTARITVIRGTEAAGPVAPSVTQDVTRTTYWDIPIAKVQISDAGVFSNFTDLREFAGNTFDARSVIDNEIVNVVNLRATVDNDTGDTGFGAAINFQLENNAGAIEDAGKIAIKYNDATANDETGFELYLKAAGTESSRAVLNAANVGVVDGSARGEGATDLQALRSNATEVASGDYSVIGGGTSNTANNTYATILGGLNNVASGYISTIGGGDENEASGGRAIIPGGSQNIASGDYATSVGRQNESNGDYTTTLGYLAIADKYGQSVQASGSFVTNVGGLAQTSKLVAHRYIASHTDTTWYEIYLDGNTPNLITLAADTLWAYNILIVGISQGATDYFAYSILGSIINCGGTTTTLNPITTDIIESDVNYEARASFDDATDSLVIEVRRNGGADKALRWVATIWLSEVTFTA